MTEVFLSALWIPYLIFTVICKIDAVIIPILQICNPSGTRSRDSERLPSAQRPLCSLEECRPPEKLTCGRGFRSGEFEISFVHTSTEQLFI